MHAQVNTDTVPLWNRLVALRFHDLGALAREVKDAPLGIDIHRAFAHCKGQPGGTKGGLASWMLENLDAAHIANALPAYETEARKYYAGKPAKTSAQVAKALKLVAQPAYETEARKYYAGKPTQVAKERNKPTPIIPAKEAPAMPQHVPQANVNGVDNLLSGIVTAAVAQALKEFNPRVAVTDMSAELLAEVDKRIEHGLAHVKPTVIKLIDGNKVTTTNLGRQHESFPMLLKLASLRQGINIWLTGPAGSGKTTAAASVAKALNLPFRYTGAINDEFKLLGYNDASGRYVPTPFRDVYENGGVFLIDEIDGSSAEAILALNAALANGCADFADGNVQRHKDCIVIAAANTYGNGATREYVGRSEIDAATLDRFVMMDWGYDEGLERDTCGNEGWAVEVQKYRKAVARANVQQMVTPRASYMGAKMLANGIGKHEVINMMIRRGMPSDQWQTVVSYAR